MSTHENDHEAFESSQLNREDLMDLSELRQQVDAFKTNNNDSELKEHIASELIKWKEYIRDHIDQKIQLNSQDCLILLIKFKVI